MKQIIILSFLLCFLAACNGPVHVAKTHNEGIKTTYQDPTLTELTSRHQRLLQELYHRFQAADIDVYPGGLGFATITDIRTNKPHRYLLVQLRPRNISFGDTNSTPEARFGEVFENHFPTCLRRMKPEDLQPGDIEGLAFGLYWPVRDLSQCDTHGGFIEYALMYLPKAHFLQFLNNKITYSQLAESAEIVTSLSGKPPEAVRVIEAQYHNKDSRKSLLSYHLAE